MHDLRLTTFLTVCRHMNFTRAAAELIDCGAPNGDMNKKFFMTKRKSRLMLESRIITGLEYYMDGELSLAVVSDELIAECGATEDDMDDDADADNSQLATAFASFSVIYRA